MELQQEQTKRKQCGGGSLSDCVRRLIREGLQRYGYWHEPAGNGASTNDETRTCQ